MSVHDLATLTRISARWIAALEQERFEQLPATVFVVGYVRNLARALGVDPSDLLSRYRAQRQTQDAALLTAASGGDRFETAMRQRKYLVFTVLAVAVGLLALLGLLLQRRPLRGQPNKYRFYIEIEGSPAQPAVQAALDQTRADGAVIRSVGSYPAGRRFES